MAELIKENLIKTIHTYDSIIEIYQSKYGLSSIWEYKEPNLINVYPIRTIDLIPDRFIHLLNPNLINGF